MPFPDPSGYDDEQEWMSACMRVALGEGRGQDQAVAICLSLWRGTSEAEVIAALKDLLITIKRVA